MRILWLPLWYPTPESPTQNVWAREMARAAAIRHEVTVIHVQSGRRGMTVGHHESLLEIRLRHPQPRFTWAVPYVLSTLVGARLARRRRSFHLVHAHCAFPSGFAGLILSRLWGIPLVLTEHWGPYDQLVSSTRLNRLAVKATVAQADAVIAVSTALRAEMVVCTGRESIEVVPPPVDTHRFQPAKPADAKSDTCRLLFVGDLNHSRKRLEDLLAALALLQHEAPARWSLNVLGGGRLLPTYEARAQEMGIQSVHFRGPAGRQEVASAMRHADIFVMPSSYETFGVVLIEALASGVPVVTTRCGGPIDIITEDVGTLVAPFDVAGLAQALVCVREKQACFLPETLHRRAVAEYSLEATSKRYDEIYQRVMR